MIRNNKTAAVNKSLKIAIITGAGSGMGRYFAYYAGHFAKDIDELWLVGRDKRKLYKTASRINKNCKCISADLSNSKEYEAFIGVIIDTAPDIRLLVNNAGIGIMGDFARIKPEENEHMAEINCVALTRLTADCLPFMSRGSHIINMASAAAFLPQPGFAVYAASKSYVYSLSKALSRELRKKKIYVTAVCPGCVDTPFIGRAEKYEKMKDYKKPFMAEARDVVLQAYRDAYCGRNVSVYGAGMKMFRVATKVLPDELILRMFF